MNPQPLPPSTPPVYPAPPRPRRRGVRIALGAVAACAIAAAGGGVGYAIGADHSSPSTANSTAEPSEEFTDPTSTTAAVPVTADDFTLDVLVEEKSCFGSAGCNVTISIDPTFNGSVTALEGRSFKVLYEITGGESPILDKFTLNGTSMRIDSSTLVQTPTEDSEITAEVTNVIETTSDY